MAMADENNFDIDLSRVQDETNAVANGNQQIDSGNPWQLPNLPQSQSNQDAEIKESTAGFPQPANDVNQLQPIQQPFPVEPSRSLDVGTEYIEHHPVQFVNNYGSRLPMSDAETTMSQGFEPMRSGSVDNTRPTSEIESDYRNSGTQIESLEEELIPPEKSSTCSGTQCKGTVFVVVSLLIVISVIVGLIKTQHGKGGDQETGHKVDSPWREEVSRAQVTTPWGEKVSRPQITTPSGEKVSKPQITTPSGKDVSRAPDRDCPNLDSDLPCFHELHTPDSIWSWSSSDTLKSPGYPLGYYSNNVDCIWIITAPHHVQLTVVSLKMERHKGDYCAFDSLTLFDGRSTCEDTQITEMCYVVVYETFVSQSNAMTLRFKTDETTVWDGFTADYKDVRTAGKRCGGDLVATVTGGTILSPGFASHEYHDADVCEWRITTRQANQQIALRINEFRIEESDYCSYDSVTIRDGENRLKILQGLCGTVSRGKSYQYGLPSILVRFKTNAAEHYGRFNISYHAVSRTGSCSSLPCLNGGSCAEVDFGYTCNCDGTRHYGDNCQHFDYCTEVTCPEGLVCKTVSFRHQCMCPEDATYYQPLGNTNCAIPAVCGDNITVTPAMLTIHVPGYVDEPSYLFASPGYPNAYKLGMECEWTLNAPSGSRLIVEFLEVDMHYTKCYNDRVTVYDGRRNNENLLEFLCKAENKVLRSSSAIMSIVMTTTEHTDRGMIAAVRLANNPCDPNPCNQGRCRLDHHSNNYTCVCHHGYKGKYCNESHDHCKNNACENNATCVYTAQDYRCLCTPWYTGQYCQDAICGKPSVQPRFTSTLKIVGGEHARAHSWPFAGSLHEQGVHTYNPKKSLNCGVVLIDKNRAITAGHCDIYVQETELLFGAHNLAYTTSRQIVTVTKFKRHPGYNKPTSTNNDITILHFWPPVTFNSYVSPVCVPAQGQEFPAGTDVYALGWGNTQEGREKPTVISNTLKQVSLRTLDNSACADKLDGYSYGVIVTDKMICTTAGESGTCQGDSGGPLVTEVDGRWTVIGLTSWGYSCAKKDTPGVFSKVSSFIYMMKQDIDVCESIDCGIGECTPLTSGVGYHCKCPDRTTQQEPCKHNVVDCGGVLSGISGLFTSPNYPRNYPNDAECTWTIQGGPGKVITVSFLDFYLQYDLSCDYDSLRAYEGRGTYGKRILNKCGWIIPADISTTAEVLTVKFISDQFTQRRGFKANYTVSSSDLPCKNVVCQNGGTCVDTGIGINDFRCQCASGWHGTHCQEFDGDSCESNPCIHGSCTDGIFRYNCTCNHGYIGENCQEVNPCGQVICHASHPSSIYDTMYKEYCSFQDHISPCDCDRTVQTPCQIITTEDAKVNPGQPKFVGSHNWPSRYPNNENRTWTLRAPPENILNVTLLYLILEENCHDKLYIHEGASVSGMEIAGLCSGDTYLPNSYMSATNVVTLQFISDASITSYGFLATVEATEQSCGQQLNATVTSQFHNILSSAESKLCSFLVTSSPGSRVEITITDGASSAPGCGAVSVLYHKNHTLRHLAPFCGDEALKINSTTNQEYITVSWSGPGTFNLVLNYKEIPDPDDCASSPCAEGATCVDRSFNYTCMCALNTSGRNCEVSHCGGALVATPTPQSLVVPDFPDYPLTCLWNITSSKPNSRINITIHDEDPTEHYYSPNCRRQYVKIYRGSYVLERTLRTFCGYNYSKPFQVSSDYARVVIESHRPLLNNSRVGITYQEIQDLDECRPNRCQNGGTCTDKAFNYECKCPANYFGRNCEEFDGDSCNPNPCVNGDCVDLHLDYRCSCKPGYGGKNCSRIDPCSGALCKTYGFCLYGDRAAPCTCYDTWTGPSCVGSNHVISASSSVNLETGDVKLISSPNWPEDYPDNANRIFTIQSPQGSSVKLVVLDLLLESDCSFDTLHIYDGSSTRGTQLKEICSRDDQSTEPIYSSSNYMTIKFRTDSSLNYRGFLMSVHPVVAGDGCRSDPCENGGTCEAHGFHHTCSCPDGYGGVNCQLHGCGGTLTSQETPQEITIPEVTDHVTGCIWNISSPAESRINLTVKEYVNQHCYDVNVDVWSGEMGALASGDILLSGHPCYLHANSSVQSTTNQMTIQYKANHDYDTERLVFTFKHVFDGDDCINNPCGDGATCLDGHFNFTCVCPEGKHGRRCEYVDYCLLNNPCPPNAKCSSPIYATEAKCTCHQGYGGDRCQYRSGCDVRLTVTGSKQYITTEGYPNSYSSDQDCYFNFVAPSGRKILVFFEVVQLETEYDFVVFPNGSKYSENPPSPLRSSGNLLKVRFTSDGSISESGVLMSYILDTNECLTSPCSNGGTCVDQYLGYNCNCTDQWIGQNCTEYNNCYPNPCVHGTCMDGENTYTCSCHDKYMGKNCTDLNPGCTNISCQNGGRCLYVNETHNSECVCRHPFHGQFCEASVCGTPQIKPRTRPPVARIVGGSEAIPHSWPWQVSLRWVVDGEHKCGGSLVRHNMVITAGHCEPKIGMTIYIGTHDVTKCERSNGCYRVTITHAWTHEGYPHVGRNPVNDIAMAKFEPNVPYGEKIAPICLPKHDDVIPIGTICYATGWGDVSTHGSSTNHLNQVYLEWVEQAVCEQDMGSRFIPEEMICAGDVQHGGRDTCHGDSGGPFVCQVPGSSEEKWKLFGITSWGDECGDVGKPGIYTRVLRYLSWIQNILDKN